jgi:hypothetical protein
MKYFSMLCMLIALLQSNVAFGLNETPVQSIKGTVIDHKNLQPLAGATIKISDTKLGAYAAGNGKFIIKDVPVGRYSISINAIGYEPRTMSIVLTSGKELDLNVELTESFVQMEEVVVTGTKGSFTPINESVIVSSTEFSVDDAQRFAGSRMDPARMAQNFAGVLGANDQRNDIIIRGGSPLELLWRLDGLDVPNPNHFATQGATGGPVSAINTNLLDNSDFITGAFPSEYYDKMSGVFDLRTRKGNQDRYEYTGVFGFNGFELDAEGPVTSNSSFIASYRYSFLGLLSDMGIDFGFIGIPKYQDATFKYDFKIDDKNLFALTGLWGTSDIYMKQSDQDSAFTGDYDIKNGTDLFTIGLNYKYLASSKFYINATIGSNWSKFRTTLDSITTDNNHKVTSIDPWFEGNNTEGFHTAKVNFNYNADSRNFITFGIESRFRYYDFAEQRYTIEDTQTEKYKLYKSGNANQYIGFLNWNYRVTEDLTANLGVTSQYLDLSKAATVEPRASLSWKFADQHSFNLGFGLHRQSLPLTIYYQKASNDNLDFMQAIHYIAGYSFTLKQDAIFKLEGYYKDLSKAPIETTSSAFSLLNSGATFGSVYATVPLVSQGLGKAYGAEFSFIKNFTNGYYVTTTASYVRQEYQGSDGIWRFGSFDNRYIFNILTGYEWKVSETFTIEFAGKYTLAGGAPYTPIDVEKSTRLKRTYYLDKDSYTSRKPDYSRCDLRIDFRQNLKNMSIISFVSIENLFDTENVLEYQWDVNNNKIKTVKQLGIFPIGGFKIEF